MKYGELSKIKGLGFMENDWAKRVGSDIYKRSMDELNDHSPLWLARVENGDCKEEALEMLQTLSDYWSEMNGKHSIFKRQVSIKINDDFSYNIIVTSFR
ncbi:MAG TPA: hypothetical protein VJ962_11685 [Clostridia bacterium]|nr:hypothetical protein [Clostridia bacterium]